MKLIKQSEQLSIKILEAQENNKLVIFVGPLISTFHPKVNLKASPTKPYLPTLEEFALTLAEGTNLSMEKDEALESFLGRLSCYNKSNKYWIHKEIKDLFASKTLYNSLHSSIISLFEQDRIRIVSTCFDNLLERAYMQIKQKGKPKVYCAPALPLGDEFSGIVYLHGLASRDYKNILLSDYDFEKAYLRNGWARRFILPLFNTYTVLFIGYAYDDIALKYFKTGAHLENLYALVENDNKDKWRYLGIKTIAYTNTNERHKSLSKLLEGWSRVYNASTHKEQKHIIKMAHYDPNNELSNSHIISQVQEYIFKKTYRLEIFLSNITTLDKWLNLFYKHKIIDDIFLSKEKELSPIKLQLVDWFSKNFVSTNSEHGFSILAQYNYSMSLSLVSKVLSDLEKNMPKEDICYKWVISILSLEYSKIIIEEHHSLTSILEKSINLNYTKCTKLLFRYILSTNSNIYNTYKPYYIASLETLPITRLWKKNTHKIIKLYYRILLPLATESITAWTPASENEPSLLRISIAESSYEHKYGYRYSYELVHLLIDIARDCTKYLLSTEQTVANAYIDIWLNSDTPILERLAIYCLSYSKPLSANRKLELVLGRGWLYRADAVNEVRILLGESYMDLSASYRKRLIHKISSYKEYDAVKNNIEIFSFIAYIYNKKKNRDCSLLENVFTEREKQLSYMKTADNKDASFSFLHKAQHNLHEDNYERNNKLIAYDIDDEEVLNKLLSIETKDEQNVFSRKAALDEITDTIIINIPWSFKLANSLIKYEKYDIDVWEAIFDGWDSVQWYYEDFDRDLSAIVIFLSNNLTKLASYHKQLSSFILKAISQKTHSLFENDLITYIKDFISLFWAKLNTKNNNSDHIVITNTPGINTIKILMILLRIEFTKENKSPSDFNTFYKDFMEKELLEKESFKAKQGQLVLFTNLNLLCQIDFHWTKEKVLSLIDFKKYYRAKDNMDEEIKALYKSYIYSFLDSIIKESMVDKVFRVYSLINNLTQRHVIGLSFVIEEYLDRLTFPEQKEKIFNIWLKGYWTKRVIQSPYEKEKQAMLLWVIHFTNNLFDRCLTVIAKGRYKGVNNRLLYCLSTREIAQNYPEQTMKLLDYIINEDFKPEDYSTDYLQDIIRQIKKSIKEDTNKLKQLLRKLLAASSAIWVYNMLLDIE